KYQGRPVTPMAGKSLLPVMRGKQREGHEVIFWEHFGASALRQGEWKLVKLDQKSDWELYNLAEDRTELHNLADEYPDKVEALSGLWNEWARELNVLPAP